MEFPSGFSGEESVGLLTVYLNCQSESFDAMKGVVRTRCSWWSVYALAIVEENAAIRTSQHVASVDGVQSLRNISVVVPNLVAPFKERGTMYKCLGVQFCCSTSM